jgi:hypothetical protein
MSKDYPSQDELRLIARERREGVREALEAEARAEQACPGHELKDEAYGTRCLHCGTVWPAADEKGTLP